MIVLGAADRRPRRVHGEARGDGRSSRTCCRGRCDPSDDGLKQVDDRGHLRSGRAGPVAAAPPPAKPAAPPPQDGGGDCRRRAMTPLRRICAEKRAAHLSAHRRGAAERGAFRRRGLSAVAQGRQRRARRRSRGRGAQDGADRIRRRPRNGRAGKPPRTRSSRSSTARCCRPTRARPAASSTPRSTSLASDANLTAGPEGTSTPTQERDSRLGKLTATVVLTGEYRNIRRFIHDLETAPEFLVIENVALSQGSERDRGLTVVVKVATYFRVAERWKLRRRPRRNARAGWLLGRAGAWRSWRSWRIRCGRSDRRPAASRRTAPAIDGPGAGRPRGRSWIRRS